MKTIITIFIASIFALQSFAQSFETDSLSKSKISELGFMVGNWKGTGWMMNREGKFDFDQTEKIQFKLDSTAILIEGMGLSDGKIIHNALAILTYNKDDKNYSFRSYLQNGTNGAFKAELIEGKLHWYPNENVRYVIWLNEKGQWYETGEFKREESWNQFFEMTLDQD